MKTTPWFPITTRPVRSGVYEVKNGGMTYYRRFGHLGEMWAFKGGASPLAANFAVAEWRWMPRNTVDDAWRGLTQRSGG
jgi:hypothetical protein